MTKLKTRLPIKALSVLMAILMIFSTMSIMFTVSAAVPANQGGGNGQWVNTNSSISVSGDGALGSPYRNQSNGYAVYLPENYESYASKPAGKKLAIMLVMSGGTSALNSNYYAMANTSGLNYLADEKGIIVIYLRQNSSTVNSSYYWNWWQPSNVTRNTTSGYIGQRATELVASIESTYSSYVDTNRTYVTGLSAGAAMAATFAALYPDVFEGAAVVAGLPFKTVTNTNKSSNYNSAYGAQGTQSASGWTQDIPTLGGFITTAWNAAGVAPENATRVITFHGTADTTVVHRNGREIADANAYARYGVNYSQKLTTVNESDYTIYYYGLDQSKLEAGYSRNRASDVAFYQIDGIGHSWLNDHANGNYGVKSNIIDYNQVMWDFFEGTPDYEDANDPITPEGEVTVNAAYGAKFCVQSGNKYADLVTAQGLQVLDLPLSPEYLMADTDPSTASQWNFNFDLSEAIDAAKAANLDTLKEVYIKNIKVYQNVWAITAGSSMNLGYATTANPVISQGGSNATDISSTKLIESWTAEYPMDTYQFTGRITDPATLDALMNYGYLSLVTYGTDGNVDFNVAAPIISIEFGKKDRNLDVEVEGDVLTARNSYPVFPVFAYNSAAGYNAPTSAANETKTYGDKQGHLIGTADKYAVGVYNAGDNNDTMYYSYNLADYTKNNGYSVQSITIKYALKGNPYYSKEDVGVKISVVGNQYWETADEAPDDMHVVENFTIAKDEKVEGEITISFDNNEHKSIINYVNNAGGFTLAFENTSNNPHYYFLITVPTIIVNYENIPGTKQNAITGIGVRFETDYEDEVSDDSFFETGSESVSDSVTISSLTPANGTYSTDTSGNQVSSGTNTTTSTTPQSDSSNAFSSYNIYDAAEAQVLASIQAKYPDMVYGEDYQITISNVTLTSATMSVIARRESSYHGGTAYGYYYPTAQSSSTSAFTGESRYQVISSSVSSSSNTTLSGTFTPNMTFTEDAPYIWLKSFGDPSSTNTSRQVLVGIPSLSNLAISYTATVSLAGVETPDEGGESGGEEPGDTPGGSVEGNTITLSTPIALSNLTSLQASYANRNSTSSSSWSTISEGNTSFNYGSAIFAFDTEAKLPEADVWAAVEAAVGKQIDDSQPKSYNLVVRLNYNIFSSGTYVMDFRCVGGQSGTPTAYSSVFDVDPTFTTAASSGSATQEITVSGDGNLWVHAAANNNWGAGMYYTTAEIVGITYDAQFASEDVIKSVSSNLNGSNVVLTILTGATVTQVKVENAADNSLVAESTQYTVVGSENSFTVEFAAPANNTTYIVYPGKNGTYGDKTFEVTVSGTEVPAEDVLMDAAGNTGVFTPGVSFEVEGDYYTDYRVVTSSTAETTPVPLSRPVDGYIVGTNNKYYTSDPSDYFTGPIKNTGSPQANVAIDVTKAAFPVSYQGYAYMNYNVSSYFAKEKPLTMVSEVVGEQQDVNGVPTQVTTRTYTETVVSSIRINSIKAQEGYTGGLAASYTVTGSSWAAGTSKWNSTTKPTNYQTLGSGSVTSSMGNIGASANLNATQMAAAKQNGYVTVWVNNDRNDWYSYYQPSAWLLVQMPEVIVTYKTITYTEKHITEIKDRNTQDTSDTSTPKITQENVTSITSSNQGWLEGTNSQYFSTSSRNYRTSQQDGYSNVTAQANTPITSTTGKFAVVYLGSGYVKYNLSGKLNQGTTYTTTGPVKSTVEINGKPTEVIKEVIDWTEVKIIGITVSGHAQAGFNGNNNRADDYSITNDFYVGGFPYWSTNSASAHPAKDAEGWQLIDSLTGTGVIGVDGTGFSGDLSPETIADVIENNSLTVRIDNTDNSWSDEYKDTAWSLITTPTITIRYTTSTWTQTRITSTQDADSFNPQFEVYAQYRFTDADGASFSKSKYLGATEGYGASGIITPYVVNKAAGATQGTVNALFAAPVNPGDKPTNSVVITENVNDPENYVLKRAYIEDTGEEIASITDNGNGTYTLNTLLDETEKTNDSYRIRIIFEYESKAETVVDESNLVKVNLHSVFENFDLNDNSLGQVGTVTETAFAKLTNSSYVLSLDDIDIPYGDMVVNGHNISAVRGTNRVYNLNNDKTTITLKNSSGTVVQTTTDADDCEITANNNMAKVYLDIDGDAPRNGDILVVTYNGNASVAGGTIDVYLHYESTPEYPIGVTYEFDIVDGNGNSLADSKYTYSTNNSYSVGSIVLPYDALATSAAEMEQFSKVSLTLDGVTSEYKVSAFKPTVVANGVTLNDEYRVTSVTSATPSVTIKYQLVLETETTANVHHVYKLVYGGMVVGTVEGVKTQADLTAPAGGSVAVVRDSMDVTYPAFGSFTASQFTPVSITSNIPELTFGTLSNGMFPATAVPYDTPEAEVTIIYELTVNKVTVNESFTQNGVPVAETVTSSVYAPVGSICTFTSAFAADYVPNNDGITLDKYNASASNNVTLSSNKGGSVSFQIASLNYDQTINIVYDYATYAQAPLNVVHQFYKNGQLVGTKTQSDVATLTNDPAGTGSYTVTPLSGTVTGISGSISSATVDANNYYANGMSSADGNVSVAGYTVTYTNNNATGPQAGIDVVVRYDITDTADVTVNHKYHINGAEVDANVTNNPTTSLTLVKDVSQSITVAQGTVNYNGTIFNLSDFTKTAVPATNDIAASGLDVTLNKFNVTEGTVTVIYELTVRTITVTEIFNNSTGTLGTETSTLYVADGKEYTFTSIYNSYEGIAISNFGREISNGYTLGVGTPATFTATATANANVTITYTVGTQANVTVNHVYYINGNPVDADVTNEPTTSLVLNKGVAQSITLAQGTVNYNGTIFNLSDFAKSAMSTNGIAVDGFDVTLTEFNIATGTVTVSYNLIVRTVNVTEIFAKDAVTVETNTTTAYIKENDNYTFTSDYNSSSIISDVALGDYIRTAEGANVTTAGNGAATFTSKITADTNVTINYAVSTKTTANVEYVYIVNGVAVPSSAFTNYAQGASTMSLVYGQAVSAPSSTGTYVLGNDSYTLASDFTKTVTVNGAAIAEGNDVTLNAYNVADDSITVTVTYEITISNEAGLNVYHTYYINGTELTGSAIAGVTSGTAQLNLEYGVSQTINKSTGTVNYNGTEFNLSQFDVTATYDSNVLSMNGLDVTLIRHNVGAQNVTLRYDLTVYTVVVNENFFINGVEQTDSAVANTYYVSAKDAALTEGLVNGSTTVNGIAVSNFIASATDNSNAIDGAITAGNYVATVNGSGIVTVNYNVSTRANVNITSVFKINGSTDGVDTTYVTNATATQNGFEYGVSTPVTSLAGGYVIWNGTQFNVSDFTTVAITDYNVDDISANGINVTLNKYNVDSTDIVITYNLVVMSVNVTENFIKDGETIESLVTTKYYKFNDDYTFVSNYGADYVPASATNSIPLSNFIATSPNAEITVNGGYVEFAGTAAIDRNVVINYNITTKANATVTHKYYFNGEEITPDITTVGSTLVSLTYGVSTPITLTQGTYVFQGKVFNLSDADITVTATPDIISAQGNNFTLNAYNATATDIIVRYDLSTVVVNITETVVTDNGAHSVVVGTQSIYLLEGEAFEFISTHAPSDTIVVNGVTIPYSLFTKTVTGADGFTVDTSSNVTISGTMEGKRADIEIVYSGVITTANIEIAQEYRYKTSPYTSKPISTFNNSASARNLSVGDKIQVLGDRELRFQVNGAPSITVNSQYFTLSTIKVTGLEGYVDDEGYFVITGISPNTSSEAEVKVTITYTIDVYSDVDVVHEFYINGKLASDATINEALTSVVIASASLANMSDAFMIVQKTSGIINSNGKTYDIADLIAGGYLTVDDALIQTTGLTITRVTAANHTNKFAVQSYDYSTDERTVVIRYDILTTLEEAEATVNTHYINNGEYVGELFESTVTNLKIGDVIAKNTVKTINGIDVTFTLQSVNANGITITEENGVYTITEIDPKATEWSVDITYVATATASVKLTHNFYVAGKLLGTITDNTVIVNLANHSGKFVALNGIVGVTTDKGVVFVDANRFTVTLASGSEYGTFANDIFTLNADALNGSTYEIAFDYNVDGISFALDGEVGVKQTASAINANGQYNVVTTVNSIGNFRPIDIIFVVDVSAGMGDVSNEKLVNTKAEISEYITNSFAVNNNVRVAIVTYADGYEVLAGGYITDKDTALATVAGITLAEAKDGYDVTASNLQAGLYGARMLMNSDVRRAYTDVIVFKGSEPNAAYSKHNDSYNYSAKVDATDDEANAAANYELDKMNASKEIVIDLTNAETNIDAKMTEIFDARNYINVDGSISITINSDEFTFVEANGVTVNGNAVAYRYEAGVLVIDLGTLKGVNEIEYTLELTNKVEGGYFVSDEIKVTYTDSVDDAVETRYGVSARVSYSTTVTGATITVITYHANNNLNPVGMDGITVKNFYEDAIIGKPVVYTVSGVTNLTAGNTYSVKSPVVSGYTLWNNEESVKTVVIPAEGENVVVYFGYYADGSIVDDSIVYDQAGGTVIDVLANDIRLDGNGFTAIYGIGTTEDEAKNGNKEKVTAASGSLEIFNGGRVIYTSNGVVAVTDQFYYAVQDGDEIRVAKIYVVPATIVKIDSSTIAELNIGDKWTFVYDVMEGIADKETYDTTPEPDSTPTSNVKPEATDDNIVLGMEYTSTTPHKDYPSGNLTDGVVSDDTLSDSTKWIGWGDGVSGSIVFDLGVDHTILDVRVHTYVRTNYGVYAPDYSISVSDDGVNYYKYNGTFSKGTGADRETFWSELQRTTPDTLLSGRYVKISFNSNGITLMSEIEIKGQSREMVDLSYTANYTTEPINGVEYTYSGSEPDRMKDDGKRLTDSSAINFDVTSNKYSAWQAEGVEIIVDLGRVRKTGSYSVYAAADSSMGIHTPANMEVFVSTDGISYNKVNGPVYKKGMESKDAVDSITTRQFTKMSIALEELIEARYVKFRVYGTGSFIWLDEVEVDDSIIKNEPCYDNLLSGKPYTSTTGTNNNPVGQKYTANLTDGEARPHNDFDGYWSGYFEGTWFGVWNNPNGGGNTTDTIGDMIFDLGEVYDLSKVRIHLDNHSDYGVAVPESLKLWVSTDGQFYGRYVEFPVLSDDEVCYWSVLDNMERMIGRYIKIEIDIDESLNKNWIFLNEIEAYGTPVVDIHDKDYDLHKHSDDADIIYGGHKENDDGEYTYDDGSALYANRYQDYVANGNVDGTDAQYTTSFSFTGTGFDIISVTGKAGGYMTIKTWDSNGNLVANASGNVLTFSKTDNIYQATVFTCTDLALDTYTVEVIAQRTYLPRIGMTDTQVYIDSVRTYNPFANNTNEHYNDLHDGTKTETLKDIFVDGKLAVSTSGNGLFTQSGMLDINSYMDKGTNNAIAIVTGQSLLFKLDDASALTTFQVEMAAIGSSATVEVYVNSKLAETLTIDTGIFAYYDFSAYIREDSTVNFKVTDGKVTFSKVRYKDAVLGEPEGEKYTTGELTNGTAPDGELMSDDYTVNTARLVNRSGTSRTITALVYTSTNVDSVIIYTSGYRIAPTSVTMKVNASGTQNLFMVTYTLPDDVPAGAVVIDFYAYDSVNNTYSSAYRSATYTLN